MDALELHEATQARGDEIEQSLEDAETARDAEAEHRESTEEAKVARWREVETGARYTRAMALAKYPRLRQDGRELKDLPMKIARKPKGCTGHHDVQTYLAADVDALAEQKKVDPRWLEVEAGARITIKMALQRYPQLNENSFKDVPVEKAARGKTPRPAAATAGAGGGDEAAARRRGGDGDESDSDDDDEAPHEDDDFRHGQWVAARASKKPARSKKPAAKKPKVTKKPAAKKPLRRHCRLRPARMGSFSAEIASF
ncbi:hypothetical protein JL720_11109 [Aureococcus anophagefferens]|nr:hypothetical protein JL720_11109 [Aureococcus anophagefferens]